MSELEVIQVIHHHDDPARKERDYWREQAFLRRDERDAIDRSFFAWRQRAYERCPELIEVSNTESKP